LNFKAQAKQNQLLERISTQHLVVGIDIAQQSHVARAVNFRGITLVRFTSPTTMPALANCCSGSRICWKRIN
jgi:hypothetical protein